ncbi:DoxX family protein [Brevundimonas sp. FT23042]|uniref:DoxX family protein n=1 Tax=Brevundimonas sp. FT23042 TaxID=3393749 RepID=UPI003B5867F3
MTPSSHTRTSPLRGRAFYKHLALWTLQSWLAMAFGGAAYAKLTEEPGTLAALLGWTEVVPIEAVRLLGAVEAVAAVGVLVPLFSWRTGAGPMTLSLITMLGLSGFMLALHLSRAEFVHAGLNFALALASVTVLVGRATSPRI